MHWAAKVGSKWCLFLRVSDGKRLPESLKGKYYCCFQQQFCLFQGYHYFEHNEKILHKFWPGDILEKHLFQVNRSDKKMSGNSSLSAKKIACQSTSKTEQSQKRLVRFLPVSHTRKLRKSNRVSLTSIFLCFDYI
jgi:hypothetical protein